MVLERLRALREDKDFKQAELAAYLNIQQTTYSKYELGKINIPLDTLMRLADFYQTSLDYLTGRTDVRVPYPHTACDKK